METRNENNNFRYTYSAKDQQELKRIRQKYAPPEENKMERIRRLDRRAYEKGTMAAIILGVIGALILGVGMCCVMVWQGVMFIPGILIGLIGIGVLSTAYPMYNRVSRMERERIAPEIIRLTDELLK